MSELTGEHASVDVCLCILAYLLMNILMRHRRVMAYRHACTRIWRVLFACTHVLNGRVHHIRQPSCKRVVLATRRRTKSSCMNMFIHEAPSRAKRMDMDKYVLRSPCRASGVENLASSSPCLPAACVSLRPCHAVCSLPFPWPPFVCLDNTIPVPCIASVVSPRSWLVVLALSQMSIRVYFFSIMPHLFRLDLGF